MHSGKAQLHSGKPSPSVENRALGEGFAECRADTRGRLDAVGRRPTPFVFFYFFIFFPECNTRERFLIFFLKYSLPSAAAQALGKEICFFLKNPSFPSATAQALGEATSKILFFLFFAFPCKQQSIYIYQKPQINTNMPQNHIYISQTTKFVRNPQYITNHIQKYTLFQVHKFNT